jgi:hypothetical protein
MESQNPRHRYLHALCLYPDLKFEAQEENESVILTLRAHPITQLPWVIASIFGFIILIVLNFFFPIFLNIRQIIFADFFFIILILSYIWLNVLFYTFNLGIVTNIRIIDIDFTSILYRETTEARLVNVEDITSKQAGYFGSFFHYGNVFVQTAGTYTNIEFLNIPEPADVVEIINRLHRH